VPRYLARVIRNCLQPKPSRRTGTATLVRRQLERGLGRISPADCRFQIATWLWERGLIQPAEGKTEIRPLAAASRSASLLHRPLARWMAPLVITATLIGVAVTANALGVFSPPPRNDPPAPGLRAGTPSELPPTAAPSEQPDLAQVVAPANVAAPAPVDPAQVRFVAWPWAEVSIEGQESFYTPRAEPVSLPPGSYRVVFEHPSYGRAEYTLDLAAGEQRSLTHVYEQAPPP
jgi:hypothetical protein